jgi:hypothetical protein
LLRRVVRRDPVALFVDPLGVYPRLLGGERCWGKGEDARLYAGPSPVVAHPPCNLWVNMAAANWWRGLGEGKGRPYPAWYTGGSDGGCFEAALFAIRMWGGVLEHPARSWAWKHFNLLPPLPRGGWSSEGHGATEWVAEVWQSAYGHPCAKATWLLVSWPHSCPPAELDWRRVPGTHQVGWFDRKKPTVSKREASATPEPFARALIELAANASFY